VAEIEAILEIYPSSGRGLARRGALALCGM